MPYAAVANKLINNALNMMMVVLARTKILVDQKTHVQGHNILVHRITAPRPKAKPEQCNVFSYQAGSPAARCT